MSTSISDHTTNTDKADQNNQMRIDLNENINKIKSLIRDAAASCNRDENEIQLIPVSKTKPAEMIQVLYDNGQKVFGENYFQELVEKSKLLPSDIQWHFIGHLQSSKASKILREVPNLDTIETVDSISLATKLNNACENINRETLNIYLQIKTSNEDSKSGIEGIENIIAVVDYILTNCSHLKLTGLMTIGAPGDSSCFDRLVSYKHALCTHNFENSKHEVLLSNLKLSMGMSGDFQEAIRHGAHIVRVGSSIFGNRIYSNANQ